MDECNNPCQEIICEVPNDLRVYSLQGLPPQQLPPVPPPPPAFTNEQVEVDNACANNQLRFTGVAPSWIQVDELENKIIGLAGAITGTTQNNANANALAALNQFITQQSVLGFLVCQNPD